MLKHRTNCCSRSGLCRSLFSPLFHVRRDRKSAYLAVADAILQWLLACSARVQRTLGRTTTKRAPLLLDGSIRIIPP